MKSPCFTIFFHFAGFFYCFVCHIAPLIIWFFKLLILLSPLLFNFRPIWHPKTLSFQQSHLQIFTSYISCLQYAKSFNCFVMHSRNWQAKISLFQFLFLKLKVVMCRWIYQQIFKSAFMHLYCTVLYSL